MPRIPKKEVPINSIGPISPRVSWQARSAPGRKPRIARSILVRLRPRLAGSRAFNVPQGLVFFSDLFSQIFSVTPFGPANKIMLM